MKLRIPLRAGSVALFVGALLLAALLGPSRRTFLTPPRVVAAASAAEFYDLCTRNGLRGRRAVVFAVGLIEAEDPMGDSPEVLRMRDLMHHGVVRELFHVVPEHRWREVELGLAAVSIYRPTSVGRVAAFEDGRVNVVRLPAFWPGEEPALVLVDPTAWSPLELQAVLDLIRTGRQRADLVAVLGATPGDLAVWSAALAGPRG